MDGPTDYSLLSTDAALQWVESNKKGLALAEAERRLKREGPNILHRPETTRPQTLLCTDPFTITLLAGAVVTIALQEYVAAFIIVVATYVHGTSTWSLARKHHRFMQHLQHRLATRPTVLRAGKRLQIDSRELVYGDIICLENGELVPADIRIIQAKRLVANAQNLTGDDTPVRKSATRLNQPVPPERQHNMLYAGSQILAGEGLGVVVATATDTLLAGRARATSALALLAPPLHRESARLKKGFTASLVTLLIGLAIAAWIARLEAHVFWNLAVLLAVATVPAGLMAELLAVAQTDSPHPRHRQAAMQHILRSGLGDSLTLVVVVVAGMISMIGFHVPPALVITEVIAFELLTQPLPIAALSWDKHPHSLRHPHLSKHLARELVDASLVAGVLAVANYVFFFARHHIAIAYMNTASSVFAQATTVALLTLVLCQWVHILCVRAHEHDKLLTKFLVSNYRLLAAFAGALVVLVGIIYLPWGHRYLGTQSLDIADWLTAIAAMAIYLGTRLLQRHTRQHTRHAIITLHQELGLNRSAK